MNIEVPNSTINRVLYEVAHKLDMVENTIYDLEKHFKTQGNMAALENHEDSDVNHQDISLINLRSIKRDLDNSYANLSKIDNVQTLLNKHAISMDLPGQTPVSLTVDEAHDWLVTPTSPAFNYQFETSIVAANKIMGHENPDNLYQVTRNVVPTETQKSAWQELVDQQANDTLNHQTQMGGHQADSPKMS